MITGGIIVVKIYTLLSYNYSI